MTCSEPQRPDDVTVKRLVQRCLRGVEVCLHDDNSQPMMYDLELRWPDGHIEALEVTRATSAALRHVAHQLDKQGPVHAIESTRTWNLHLAPSTTDVACVRREIDHLLSLVERAGFTKFGPPEARRSSVVAEVRQRLGVDSGWSREAASGQPRIFLNVPQRWWFQNPETVNAVVEDHAQRNQEKLARSGCAERHLFVLFDFGELEAWSVLRDGELPEMPPQLPDAVTTVWVATYQQGEPVVWRVRQDGRWEVLL
jgi:hypothetical protein